MKSSATVWIAQLTVSFFWYVFLWTPVTVIISVSATESETTEGSAATITAVLASLHGGSEADFQKVLQNVKHQKQENFLRLYIAEIPKLPPVRQPAAIRLLQERDDFEFLPSTILRLAKNGTDEVRIAAVEVMKIHGHSGCVPVLLEILVVTGTDGESPPTPTTLQLRATSLRILNSLKGEEVDDAIVWELRSTDSRIQRLAMQQIQARPIRTSEAEAELWAILTDNRVTDNTVTEDTVSLRQLAVTTLGHIAATESLTRMTKELAIGNHSTAKATTTTIPAADWITAMEMVAQRTADPTVAVRKMLIGLDNTSLETQCNVLRVIGKLTGPYTKSVLEAASMDDREPIRAIAISLLAAQQFNGLNQR